MGSIRVHALPLSKEIRSKMVVNDPEVGRETGLPGQWMLP